MEIVTLCIQLFCTFFVIGIFTFGGGYAMLSLIQTQVCVTHQWLSESTFTNIVAISQMTPGPIGINCATYTGYQVLKDAGCNYAVSVLGSLSTTSALVLPSFLIVLLIVRFYEKFMGNTLFEGMMSWMRPAVTGLIGAAAIILVIKTSWGGAPLFSTPHVEVLRENFIDWKSWMLFAMAMVASLFFKVGPLSVIIGGAIAGLLLY